ncbi:outer membrane lipoprotein carrier protein LolA [Microbulbifer variabilis]|uniref:Outer membrane lipoprotein carrier protein LolA n=1 Tax=Microbulbifer variabilis TaxID=266805 RepID=A0ABY4VIB2_9GAMM|nr:outer membrane lipoprotein carrier protein LolA [Microbulbifer variabilis]USD21639.1 outer membrane lipoprotein carrier protein LolA [Microbulbifer variabilis]
MTVTRLVVFFICFLFSTVTSALTSEQQAVLREIEKNIVSSPQMLGTFAQTKRLPQLPRPLVSSGVLAISEELGLSWRIENPIESHRIFKLDDADFGNRINSNIVGNHVADPLLKIISGDFSELDQTFTVGPQIAEEQWRINLIPKQEAFRKVIESIEVVGDKKIRKIVLAEANMAITEIDIMNLHSVEANNSQLLSEFSEDNQK